MSCTNIYLLIDEFDRLISGFYVQKLETIKKISNIKTLVLGSSHIEVSFIAESNEYNLALSSQDLYYPPSWMSKGGAPCPRSVEFQRPSINFLLGTTVYEAINY